MSGHPVNGKEVDVLGIEDVALDMSEIQQNYVQVVNSYCIEGSCMNQIDP